MRNSKKTLLGSIIVFFIGSSCCWLTSLGLWIGGATLIGTVASYIDHLQTPLFVLGIILLMIALFKYIREHKKNTTENSL